MNIMKTITEKDNYTSPSIEVVEIQTEGVLCMSGTGAYEDLTEEEFEW